MKHLLTAVMSVNNVGDGESLPEREMSSGCLQTITTAPREQLTS